MMKSGDKVGRYELVERIGRGGFGDVWRAFQPDLGRSVALKVMNGEGAPQDVVRFHREAEAMAKLSHPNVAQVFEFGEHEGQMFIAMELIEAGTLVGWLKKEPPIRARLEMMERICIAVHAAHEHGIVHRDLKPHNVLLTPDGDPKVVDFGLALDSTKTRVTVAGDVMGTPQYMAPEQVRGEEADRRTDVYALGVMLYELATDRLPFTGKTAVEVMRQVDGSEPIAPRRLDRKLPRDLELVILKAMDKDPSRRYASAAAMGEDIQNVLNFEPVSAKPAGLVRRSRVWLRKHWWSMPIAASLMVGAGVGLWFKIEADRAEESRRDQERQALQSARLKLRLMELNGTEDWEGMLKGARQLLEIDRCWEGHYFAGCALQRMSRLEEAERDLREGCTLGGTPACWGMLALCLVQAGRSEDARAALLQGRERWGGDLFDGYAQGLGLSLDGQEY